MAFDGDSKLKRFEKSLYDLIRGLRNHKGNERQYIQDSIKECRKEIKSQDMDMKATAVLKLTYLEMFGHDMSWASFNVLEVMSSSNYALKKVGYLGAIQSFRPDTEILLLAENLLKKDLNSPQVITMSLPMLAIPHVISPSMANSLLSDLLKRLSHSEPAVRKKTVVALYRLALVYPETLRPAWPRIREKLSDENEDPSVTAAVVNVVCELGWRRPQDFLPLAPRLFDLLVDGGNNWMAIKLIKLFASLTHLEPRLVKKLLPPLTTIIKSTPAMSLLYECITGIIDGGILEKSAGTTEGDDIARLCIGKLRSMLVIEGDPNLKYVALLAFNKIVELHPYLVSMHEDVILECIDDADISIRLRALDLVVGMVNAQNLTSIVDRLIRQLVNSSVANPKDAQENDRGLYVGVEPEGYSDDEEAEQALEQHDMDSHDSPPLPDEYRTNIIRRIMEMCRRETYAFINDFEWYIGILTKLVRHAPTISGSLLEAHTEPSTNVAYEIGKELRNVAVRVKSSREEATRAAEALVSIDKRAQLFPLTGNGGIHVLGPTVWIVGEFAVHLWDADSTLTSLLNSSTVQLPDEILIHYIQAISKIFSFLISDDRRAWTGEVKTRSSLTIARVVHFLEPLANHPNLEVQERAVEYLELARLASEAAAAQDTETDDGTTMNPPLVLTQAIPSLFAGMELNPVAQDAQSKVPVPEDLDLDEPINASLTTLLQVPEISLQTVVDNEFYQFYNEKTTKLRNFTEPAASRLDQVEAEYSSYQQNEMEQTDSEAEARRRAERRARNKDDPFYIPSERDQIHNILRSNIGDDVDVDSIPIMKLDLSQDESGKQTPLSTGVPIKSNKSSKPRQRLEILGDESIDDSDQSRPHSLGSGPLSRLQLPNRAGKKSLLQVDSSGLSALSLEGNTSMTQLDIDRREAEEAEMAQAIREVERMRLEMQRASETIEPSNGPSEGIVVKRKKKKKNKVDFIGSTDDASAVDGNEEKVIAPKKKKKKKKVGEASTEVNEEDAVDATGEGTTTIATKKKKKKRVINFDAGGDTIGA